MSELDDFHLIHSPGDYELWKLCKLLVKAVEWRPEPGGDTGVLFEQTANRYFEKVMKSERNSAEWFYRNKTSFDAKYDEDCGDEGNREPAWVSDQGQGAEAVRRGTISCLAQDRREKRRRAALAKAHRISPTLARTLNLIIRNGSNRKESIGALMTGTSWHQAEVLYYRHRAALIRMFGGAKD